MLARLAAVEGVTDARVEATGRLFLLELASGADEEIALAAVAAALRRAPRRLGPGEAAAQLARRGEGDPWYSVRDVAALSFLEARLLAARGAPEVATAAGLAPAEREAVEDALREVLLAAMARVLAEGGRDSSGWFYEEWPALAAAAAARCLPAVAAERRERAAAALAALHAPGARATTG